MQICTSLLRTGMLRRRCVSAAPKALIVSSMILAMAGFAMSQTVTYRTLKRLPPGQRGLLAGVPLAFWSDGLAGGGYVKPDPNYKPARTPDGHPDIQGSWAATTVTGTQTVEANPAGDDGFFFGKTGSIVVEPPDGKIPYKPWARARTRELIAHYTDPLATCVPTGLPRTMYYLNYEIFQTSAEVMLISEHLPNFRHIPVDGRSHIGTGMKLWMGDSRGHWEGDTLVIDVTNLNDETWLSVQGDFHSNKEHITERLTPIDAETMQYEATIEDTEVYEKPWKMAFPLIRLPNTYEMLEENCPEGNRSIDVQIGLGYKPFTGVF